MDENNINNQAPQEQYGTTPNQTYVPKQPEPDNQSADGFAIGALVTGIAGTLSMCCCAFISLPMGVTGIILSILGLRRGGKLKGLAIAGIVMSALSILFALIILVVMLISYGFNYGDMYYDIENFLETV